MASSLVHLMASSMAPLKDCHWASENACSMARSTVPEKEYYSGAVTASLKALGKEYCLVTATADSMESSKALETERYVAAVMEY